MKHVTRILSLLALSATIFLAGCDKGDDNKKSKSDQQIEKLVGTWTAQEVKYVGTIKDEYEGFTLTISGSAGDDQLSYTTTNRPASSPWPGSGNFTFGSPATTQLIRKDNTGEDLNILYSVGDNILSMEFNYKGEPFTGGRTAEVSGQWEFQFIKQ